MDYKEIIKSIRQKQFKPIYFLHGEEPFFIDAIAEVIENEILSDAEKGFNQTVLYGKESTVQHIVDSATRYPMMSQHQVVVVKELQEMDIFKRSKDNDDLKRLQNYLEHPLSSTVLLLAYKHKKWICERHSPRL